MVLNLSGFPKLETVKWNVDISQSDDAFNPNTSNRQKRRWMAAHRDLYMSSTTSFFNACPEMRRMEWWLQYYGSAHWDAKVSERDAGGIVSDRNVDLTFLGISGYD